MITLSEETVIPSPPDVVWPYLRDPALVASCIPGAELSPDSSDGAWSGSIKVKFGPTVTTFRGEAALKFDDATMTCTMEGRGIDQRGASRALASGKLTVTGDTETTLSIEGEFNVTGPLETFANAGGVHVARALLGEFSTNLTNLVLAQGDESSASNDQNENVSASEDGGVEPQAPRAAPAPARELSAFSILFKAFKSWLGGLFGK